MIQGPEPGVRFLLKAERVQSNIHVLNCCAKMLNLIWALFAAVVKLYCAHQNMYKAAGHD